MTPQVGQHVLLQNEGDFHEFRKQFSSDIGEDAPDKYPCFAQQVTDGSEWSHYEFLYFEDVSRMFAALYPQPAKG